MATIVPLAVITSLPIPTEKVLESAIGSVSKVIVIGETENGEFYFALSHSSGPDALWLIEQAKFELLKSAFDDAALQSAEGK